MRNHHTVLPCGPPGPEVALAGVDELLIMYQSLEDHVHDVWMHRLPY
jgi:hypothetical protein